jgi:hypothetical protein
MTPTPHALSVAPPTPSLMLQSDCLSLIRDGNLHGEWRPFLFALERGMLPLDLTRPAADGTRRPVLLSMILIKAPLAVVGAAIRAGCPTDPDQYLPAIASGSPLKVDLLRHTGTPADRLSIPAATLLSAAIAHRLPALLERSWRLRDDWDPADLRETAGLFDLALRQQAPLAVLDFLLARQIGPSLALLRHGVAALPAGVAERLLARGWPLPPCRDGDAAPCCADRVTRH